MLQTLLTRRWLARLAALLLLIGVFTWLGFWQLGVAYSKGRAEALAAQSTRQEAPLQDVLRPHTTFPDDGMNRPVRVSGTYEPDKQLLVPDRLLQGRRGYWVITPLRVDGTDARLVVVRGFVTDPAQASRPRAARVEMHASLAQPEGQPPRFDVPEGQIASIDPGTLLNRWGGSIYNGFVFAQSETPDLNAGTRIERVPPPRPTNTGVNWRNLFYALQWWLFALLVTYVFVRVLREEARGTGPGAATVADEPTPQHATTAQDQEHA